MDRATFQVLRQGYPLALQACRESRPLFTPADLRRWFNIVLYTNDHA